MSGQSRAGNSKMTEQKRVLILCAGNSARSQMAEGLLRHDGGEKFAVFSAGTRPGSVRPEAVAAMRESGLTSLHTARSLWTNSPVKSSTM